MPFKSFILFTLTVTFVTGLSACAKKDQSEDARNEEIRGRAVSLVNRQNSLIRKLNAAGVPDLSWSDQQLAAHLADLSSLEKVEAEIPAVDGNAGVRITGGTNVDFIRAHRQRIAAIQTAKSADAGQKP